MRDLPETVAAKARDVGAAWWVEALPRLTAELAGRWELRLGAAFTDSTEAYVVRATRRGEPVVLKLLVPRATTAAAHEIAVLRQADGHGCVRLLEHDAAAGAMLLERLGPSMHDLGLPQPERLDILCDLAAAVWTRTPPGGLPTGAEKAIWLSHYIERTWYRAGRPCTRRTVDQALAAADSRRRAHQPDRAVLVHGDVHEWNALRAGDGFRLVDPDGLVAEPEYDLGVLMREDPAELMAGDPWDRARHLAARTGRDVTAIWEWGLAERVSTGLLATVIGLQPVGGRMLAAADLISSRWSAASAG